MPSEPRLDTTHLDIQRYRPELKDDFDKLNREWLVGNSLLEPADVAMLADPDGEILRPGGEIFFAVDDRRVVGTCAAIRVSDSAFELAKLAVSPSAQGRGIGRILAGEAIRFAREAGATTIVLSSNSALVPAIRLYESLGFAHAPLPADIPYATADVYMTLVL